MITNRNLNRTAVLIYFFLISNFITFTNVIAESPYSISWEKDGAILGAGLGVLAAGLILENSILME